jgi:hypothetical protein
MKNFSDLKRIKVMVAMLGRSGVEVVENGLGGICTISLENSFYESYQFLEIIREFNKDDRFGSFWFEPYSSCEIVVGLE